MMPLLFSVVIPTYKRPQLLQKCLDALLLQKTNVPFEVIVVSDGKDEETARLLEEYADTKIPFFYEPLAQKKGPAAARNKGWQIARGELVVFTDDDTQPHEQWLQKYWQAYVPNYQSEIAFTGVVKVPVSNKPTDYEKNTAGLETADFVTANCACTKKALQKIGGFDEDFTMAWREDSELEFKLLHHNIPIHKIQDALVIHPVRQASWGVSLKEQKKSMFNALLFKKHPQLFRKKILATPLWNYYAMILFFMAAPLLAGMHLWLPALLCMAGWEWLTASFILRRLKGSSHSFKHITEMVVTSVVIPFLSVYWTLYGAVKFKVFFL